MAVPRPATCPFWPRSTHPGVLGHLRSRPRREGGGTVPRAHSREIRQVPCRIGPACRGSSAVRYHREQREAIGGDVDSGGCPSRLLEFLIQRSYCVAKGAAEPDLVVEGIGRGVPELAKTVNAANCKANAVFSNASSTVAQLKQQQRRWQGQFVRRRTGRGRSPGRRVSSLTSRP
jgi:hypothetical protein